jgi:predicted Zn-dependent peptidase
MKKKVFTNGLRLINVPLIGAKAVTVLVMVNFGSKHEEKRTSGISHFLEHMYFKGTQKRPNVESVAGFLDKVGGEYNAFTGNEYTGYYAKISLNHWEKAVDWVSDIFLNSTLPEKEIKKEKGVIVEEINMIKDNPMSHVQEMWDKLLYGDQPAGWNIAGTKESVMNIKRKDLVEHMEKGYLSQNTLVCLSGAVSSQKAEEVIRRKFSGIKQGSKPFLKKTIENQKEPMVLFEKRETDQVHFCLGTRTNNLFHEDRYVLDVIETILGGMMSSRLFIKIRDELGLAYYIKTNVQLASDVGFLVTQAGVALNKVEKAVSAVVKEYVKLTQKKVDFSELKKAKENIKGRLALNLESSSSQAFFYTAQEIIENRTQTPEEIFKKIDKVSANDIMRVSREIFTPEKINLTVLGPAEKDFKKLLKI